MRKIVACVLFTLAVAAYCVAVPVTRVNAEPNQMDSHYIGGFWTKGRSDQPYATMNHMHGMAYIAVSKSQSSKACEFAIIADKDGVRFQIIDDAGGYHSIPATALLKLEDKAK